MATYFKFNQDSAKALIPTSRKYLALAEAQLKLSGLNSINKTHNLPDGSVITLGISKLAGGYGNLHSFVNINTPIIIKNPTGILYIKFTNLSNTYINTLEDLGGSLFDNVITLPNGEESSAVISGSIDSYVKGDSDTLLNMKNACYLNGKFISVSGSPSTVLPNNGSLIYRNKNGNKDFFFMESFPNGMSFISKRSIVSQNSSDILVSGSLVIDSFFTENWTLFFTASGVPKFKNSNKTIILAQYPYGTLIGRVDFNTDYTTATYSSVANLQVFDESLHQNLDNKYLVAMYTSHLSEKCIFHVNGTYRAGEPFIHRFYEYNPVTNILSLLPYDGSYHKETITPSNDGSSRLKTKEGKYPVYMSNDTGEIIYFQFNTKILISGITVSPVSSELKLTIVDKLRTKDVTLLDIAPTDEMPYILTDNINTGFSTANFLCYTAETEDLIAICFGYWVYTNYPSLTTNKSLITRSFLINKSDLSFSIVQGRTRQDYPHKVEFVPYLSTEK
jgi:hypothetical protein